MTIKEYIISGILGKLYPDFRLMDTKRVKTVETEYGSFNYTKALQVYYNLFEQIDDYDLSDLSPEDVVLDIGACVGASTVKMAKIADFVIAIEPVFFDDLKNNVQLNALKNVLCLPYALDDTFCEKTISFAGKTEYVKCVLMGSLLKNCPKKPTFLKTDCEGGEWGIKPRHLEGIRAVEAEIHNFDGHKPEDFVAMLKNEGFLVRSEKTPEGQLMVHARRQV